MIAAIRIRDIVGQVKGISTQEGIDETAACAMLMAASDRMNIRLREVARQNVDRRQQ